MSKYLGITTSPIHLERKARNAGYFYVIGIDEAGRGAWAGPLTVGYCVLPFRTPSPSPTGIKMNHIPDSVSDAMASNLAENQAITTDFAGVTDSKLLVPAKREELAGVIREKSLIFGSYSISAKDVDRLGLSKSQSIAVAAVVVESVLKLHHLSQAKPDVYPAVCFDNVMLLSDHGLASPKEIESRIKCQEYVRGELKSLSIAAASIIAKTDRDHYMRNIPDDQWGFADHKGYGTKKHLSSIKEFGLHPEHRVSFGNLASFSIGNV